MIALLVGLLLQELIMTIKIQRLIIVLMASLTSGIAMAQDSPSLLTLYKTIPLPNVEGRIDHMAVDVAEQRLFVAALGNNTVEVVDLKTGKVIQSLSGFAEPQGIAYVPEFDRLFVANGADGTCRILDGHSLQTISKVELGDDADNVRYDAAAKKIYVGYGDGAIAIVDAKTGQKIADIQLAKHPESFRLATTGPNIFVNVPKANHIAVMDRDQEKVTATWPLTEAKANFPMYLDETNHRMFVGCRNPNKLLVHDMSTGKLVASVPISGDTDDLFYDANNQLIYVSCGVGVIDVIKQTDADHYAKIQTLPTASGARTSYFVPELKMLCLAVPHRGSQIPEIRIYKTQ